MQKIRFTMWLFSVQVRRGCRLPYTPHAAPRKVSVLVFGKQAKSSLFHAHVENFCCLFNVPGEDMLRTGREQASRFGAEIVDEDAMKVSANDQLLDIATESGRLRKGVEDRVGHRAGFN